MASRSTVELAGLSSIVLCVTTRNNDELNTYSQLLLKAPQSSLLFVGILGLMIVSTECKCGLFVLHCSFLVQMFV